MFDKARLSFCKHDYKIIVCWSLSVDFLSSAKQQLVATAGHQPLSQCFASCLVAWTNLLEFSSGTCTSSWCSNIRKISAVDHSCKRHRFCKIYQNFIPSDFLYHSLPQIQLVPNTTRRCAWIRHSSNESSPKWRPSSRLGPRSTIGWQLKKNYILFLFLFEIYKENSVPCWFSLFLYLLSVNKYYHNSFCAWQFKYVYRIRWFCGPVMCD